MWSMFWELAGFGCGWGPMNARFDPLLRRLPALPAPWHDEAAAVPRRAADRRRHAQLARRRALRARTSSSCCARSSRREVTPDLLLPDRPADPGDGRARQDALPRLRAPSTTWSCSSASRSRPPDDLWISGAKLVWCFIWFWAATSKLNSHFPSVIMFMMNNGPFFPKALKKRLFTHFPDDLRPSRFATLDGALRHRRRVLDPGRSSSSAPATRPRRSLGLLPHDRLPRLHRHEQPERHAGRVEHPDDLRRLVPVRVPPRGASRRADRRCRVLLAALLLLARRRAGARQLRSRRRVSFLLSMRYYAGNWAYNIWLVRKGAAAKFDKLKKAAAPCREQLAEVRARPGGVEVAKAHDARQPLHALRGTARCSRRCRARSTTSTTTSGTRAS